jgi:hypothetical protein
MNELQPIETEVAGQRPLFDYAALDAETRIVVQQRAGEIKSIAKRMAADVVEIGEKLGDVKQRLGANDRFNDWLSAELGWSPRTAHNFIGVWRRFGSANFAIENVAVSALYALAAPSTPIEAIEEVKQIADSGQEVTHTVAKEIIEKAKATRPKQAELAEAVDPSTICLCGCKAGDHVRNGRYLECANCECEIFQEASAEEIVERNTAEKALGITPSKRTASGPASTPTPETVARLKAEMELEESDDREKAPGEPSTEFFARPAGWFNSPIEIRITLLPGGDAETRKIQYAVRDAAIQFRAAPLTAEDYGEDTLLRLLPDAAYKLVEQLAAEWGKNQWSDVAKKRLKAEAIARWRREPVEMVELDDGVGADVPADELETLRNLLALVIENEIPIEAIRRWTDEQKRQAREWASAAHLRASDHDIEVPARPETLQACICGELGYEHAGGVCMLDDCGCQQWRPGNYAQCSRCKGEIVTTANLKDFDGLCFNCRVADEEGESASIELPQEEINRIADLCNAGRLGEKGPLKPLAYVDGHPYLVTGAMGSGDAKNWSKAWAWPVYPPYSLTAKQTNQRTYEETRAAYYKRLEEEDDFHGPIDYNGVKINVGTKKKPNEWVMVGPKVTFVVDGEGTPVQKEETQIDGEKPALIELPQAEIDRMSEYSASGQIPNEQPVKICHIFNQPHVITGAVWKGEDCLMVFAMPILPLGNFGEEKAKTYSQAVAARRRGGISEALSYEGIKINCGSKKKPDWWVMVRPNKTFTVDYAAAYPNDEIEADPEEVDLPQVEEPTLEAALYHALHHVQNAAERWKPLQYSGADDHELMTAIALEFVGQGGSSQNGGWSVKGGKAPQFTWERDGSTLKGKRLLAKVREVLQIGPPIPAETAPADADDFTAPRCSECGRIDGAHTPECSQNPNMLTFEDYLAYAKFTKPEKPQSWARKWALTKEMDGPVQAWKLYWKELEDSGVIPFLQLCLCGHPLLKHKPEVGCGAKLGDQDCQCVAFVASAETEEPKRAEKGRAAW